MVHLLQPYRFGGGGGTPPTGPAPTRRTVTDTGFFSGSTGVTFSSADAGNPVADDIIVVHLYIEALVTVTPPAGWTSTFAGVPMEAQSTSDQLWESRTYWIRRGASNPSFAFTWSSNAGGQCACASYTGARASGDPWSVADLELRDNNVSTSFPTASGTTLDPEERLIWIGNQYVGSGSHTVPTGFTSVYGHDDVYWAERTTTSAGTYSTPGGSWSGLAHPAMSTLLCLRPA